MIAPGTGPCARTPAAKGRVGTRHAARLGRHCGCARLHRAPVPGGELRRPRPPFGPRRPGAAADLSAVACDLLHLVDVLRLGRLGLAQRLRVPRHLCRPGADDRPVRADDRARGAARQGAEHHLDRRFHRRALRQEPGGRRDRGADRDHRHGSLHRAAAQGGVVFAGNDHRPLHAGRRNRPSAARRHGALCRAVDGGVRGAVRHAPHRRDRAPGRPDARGRRGIDRQAAVVPGGRHLRHLLDVRRPGRAVQQGDEFAAGRFGADPRAAAGTFCLRARCCRSSRSCCCRGSSTSPSSRTTTSARSSARAGCFRSISS